MVAALLCALHTTPMSEAATDSWCGPVLGGAWNDQTATCSLHLVSRNTAAMNISLAVPPTLAVDPTAGPVIRDYVVERGRQWTATSQAIPRDNTAFVEPAVYTHPAAIQTVVFHEQFHTEGTNPNDAYRTFTFDLARGRQLALSDLFAPGVDPLTALPPLVRPYLEDALAAAAPPHLPDTYPFVADKWEPHPDGSGFADNYAAFALTPTELILYMPAHPMSHEKDPQPGQFAWSMNGGTVIVHVPLTALATILREDLS